MSEGLSVGDLVLTLGLDTSGYSAGMDAARAEAIAFGREIERSLKRSLPTLVARVDDRALTKLNKHLDLKQRHFDQVNRHFAQKPLTPRVNFRELEQLERRLNRLNSSAPTVRVAGGGSASSNNTAQLADQIGRSVARHSRPNLAARAIGGVGSLAKIPLQLAGGAASSVASGLMFGVTQEVTKNFGKGLSGAIERSIGGVAGSTGLVGSKLGEAIAKKITDSIDKKLSDQVQDIAKNAIAKALGEEDIQTEALATRAKQRAKTEARSPQIREQAQVENRDAMRAQTELRREIASKENFIEYNNERETELSQKAFERQEKINTLETEYSTTIRPGQQGRNRAFLNQIRKAERRAGELETTLASDSELMGRRNSVQMTIANMKSAGLKPDTDTTSELKQIEREIAAAQKELDAIPTLIDALSTKLADTFRDKASGQAAISMLQEVEQLRSEFVKARVKLSEVVDEREAAEKVLEELRGTEVSIERNAGRARSVRDSFRQSDRPVLYEQALRQVAPDLPESMKPQLVVDDAAAEEGGFTAEYDALSNSIRTTSAFKEAIDKQEVSEKQLGDLFEEIRHSADAGFGSFEGSERFAAGDLLTRHAPTPEELEAIAPELQHYAPEHRDRELSAKVAARRDARAMMQERDRQAAIQAQAEAAVAARQQVEAAIVDQVQNRKPLAEKMLDTSASNLESMGGLATRFRLTDEQKQIAHFQKALKQYFLEIPQIIEQIKQGDSLDTNSLEQTGEALAASIDGIERMYREIARSKTRILQLAREAQAAEQATISEAPLNLPKKLELPEPEMVGLKPVERVKTQRLEAEARPSVDFQSKASSGVQDTPLDLAIDSQITPDSAKARAQSLAEIFQSGYQDFKRLKEQNKTEAVKQAKAIAHLGDSAMQEITKLIGELKAAGFDTGFGSEATTALGNLKGQISRKRNEADRYDRQQAKAANKSQPEGDAYRAQSLAIPSVNRFQAAIQSATDSLNQFVANRFEVEAQDSLAATAIAAAQSEKGQAQIKDLAVNTAGFAASKLGEQFGIVPELGGDLMGALAARQAINLGVTGHQAYSKLKDTETFKAADALKKFQMVLLEVTRTMQGETFANMQSEELFGDVAGFGVGNLVANLPAIASGIPGMEALGHIPLRGAASAMAAVPQLSKLRGRISDRIRTEEDSGYRAQSLDLDRASRSRRLSKEELTELKQLNALLAEAEKHADRFDAAFGRMDASSAKEFEQGAQAVQEMSDALAKGEQISTPAAEGLGKLGKFGRFAVGAFAAFSAIAFVAPMLKDIATSSINVAVEMEQVGRTFEFAYGSIDKGRAAMDQTRASAKALGVDLRSALQGQAQLAMAAQGTKLQGFAVEQVERGMIEASAVSSLNDDQQNRAYLATSQMIGKGKIQAEELRGQLAEVGGVFGKSFQIMADSIGVTAQELDGMLMRGEVISEEVLPKFFAQLSAESAAGLPGAAKSSQAAMNNLNNSVTELQESLGKPLLPARNLGLNALASGADLVKNLAGVIVQLLGSAAVAAIAQFVLSLGMGTKAMSLWALVSKGATAAFSGFLKLLNSPANSMAGFTVGIFGAIEVLKIFGKAFSDSGGKAREFATQATESLEKYRQQLAETQKQGAVPAPNPSRSRFGDTGESLLEGSIVGSVIGQGASRFVERGVQGLMSQAWGGRSFNVMGMELRPGATYGELQGQQQAIARGDALTASNNVLQEMQSRLEGYRGGVDGTAPQSGSLSALSNINRQIEAVQGQRRALLPGQSDQRKALDAQEQDLMRQREPLDREIRGLTAQNAAAIETFKQLRDEALDQGDTAAVAQYEQQLEAATKMQAEFNTAIGQTPDVLGQLTRAFGEIQGALEKTNQELERSAAAGRKAIASSIIAGTSTAGEREFTAAANEQQNMQGRMNANDRASLQARSSLENNPKVMQALDRAGVRSIDDINPTTLAAQIAGRSDDDPDKALIQQAIEQKTQIDSRTTENANLDAQIEESKAQVVQKLRDLSVQVFDFYRGIENSAKEIGLQAQQTEIQSRTSDAQSALRGALVGLQDSFFNGFIQSLIEVVEAFNKPIEDAIGSQQQMLAAQQQYFQQVQQAYGMQQQLPSIGQVAGQDPSVLQGMMPNQAGQAAPGAAMMPSFGAMPSQAIAPAVGQMPGQMPAVPQGMGVNPSMISAPLNQLQQANPLQAVTYSQQGIQAGVALAGQNYQQQIANIQRQEQSNSFARRVEQEMKVAEAHSQVYQINRQINEMNRTRRRGLEDLQLSTQVQTPEVERQQRMLGIDRDHEDRTRGAQENLRGYEQSIKQLEIARSALSDSIAQGLVSPEAQQFVDLMDTQLASLHQGIAGVNADLQTMNRAYEEARAFAEAEERRLEEERRYQARSRLQGMAQQQNGAASEGLRTQARRARNRGDGIVAADLEQRASLNDLQGRQDQVSQELERTNRELRELHRTGQLTDDEFQEMRRSAENFANTSLENIRGEMAAVNEEAERANSDRQFQVNSRRNGLQNDLLRSQAQGDRLVGRNGRADDLEFRANLNEIAQQTQQQLRDLEEMRRSVGMTNAEYQEQAALIREIGAQNERNTRQERDNAFRERGGMILTGADIGLEREATTQIQQAEARGTAALASTVASGRRNNQFYDVVMSRGDRDYVSQLADLIDQGGFGGRMQAERLSAQFDAGYITQDQLSAKLDELLQGIRGMANAPRTLIAQTPDPVRDLQRISNDFTGARMGAAGL